MQATISLKETRSNSRVRAIFTNSSSKTKTQNKLSIPKLRLHLRIILPGASRAIFRPCPKKRQQKSNNRSGRPCKICRFHANCFARSFNSSRKACNNGEVWPRHNAPITTGVKSGNDKARTLGDGCDFGTDTVTQMPKPFAT